MSHVLGRVDYDDGVTPSRFFVHDNTSGWSIPTLFSDPDEAWRIYDHGKSRAMQSVVPAHSTHVRAVRKVLTNGRGFDSEESTTREPQFGLATEDRLLLPLTEGGNEDKYLLLQVEGVLHVAQETDGGFSGAYAHPLCKDRWEYSAQNQEFAFDDVLGRTLVLCPLCLKRLFDASTRTSSAKKPDSAAMKRPVGRPAAVGGKRVQVYLDDDSLFIAGWIGKDGNVSDGIRKALRQALEKRDSRER
ncbi:hypothetical protein RAS12_30815 (plasmid) [Achromobacter seleniivolatilans]|uniref:Uncharacterized protein n=1 Tax=Achromobacter seleniivolatilans TaxID=3047478 RepID=A0ABY9MBK0_9BURK|nr:hypothetical protein [Achromobacter sp. R39]WMD24027.1 hypothetical protein RAS12_30815 [Achromobacter sp. R39]